MSSLNSILQWARLIIPQPFHRHFYCTMPGVPCKRVHKADIRTPNKDLDKDVTTWEGCQHLEGHFQLMDGVTHWLNHQQQLKASKTAGLWKDFVPTLSVLLLSFLLSFVQFGEELQCLGALIVLIWLVCFSQEDIHLWKLESKHRFCHVGTDRHDWEVLNRKSYYY